MPSDILQFFERASAENPEQPHDPKYMRAMGLIVPKNSGIQTVYTKIHLTMNMAKNMHWKFRQYAVKMAKAREYGLVAITSENGGGIKSFNTERFEQGLSQNKSLQKADSWDNMLYGQKRFENN